MWETEISNIKQIRSQLLRPTTIFDNVHKQRLFNTHPSSLLSFSRTDLLVYALLSWLLRYWEQLKKAFLWFKFKWWLTAPEWLALDFAWGAFLPVDNMCIEAVNVSCQNKESRWHKQPDLDPWCWPTHVRLCSWHRSCQLTRLQFCGDVEICDVNMTWRQNKEKDSNTITSITGFIAINTITHCKMNTSKNDLSGSRIQSASDILTLKMPHLQRQIPKLENAVHWWLHSPVSVSWLLYTLSC